MSTFHTCFVVKSDFVMDIGHISSIPLSLLQSPSLLSFLFLLINAVRPFDCPILCPFKYKPLDSRLSYAAIAIDFHSELIRRAFISIGGDSPSLSASLSSCPISNPEIFSLSVRPFGPPPPQIINSAVKRYLCQ